MAVSHSAAAQSEAEFSSVVPEGRVTDYMKISLPLLTVLLTVGLPLAVQAQGDDQYSWGVSAGAAVPTRKLADDHNTGVNAGITFAFGRVGQFLGIRVDGMFNQFSAKSASGAGNARIIAGTFNLVTGLLGDVTRVYLIGGVGGYSLHPDVAGLKTVNDFGLNGGVGLWLPFMNAFVEARYHHFYRALPDKHPAVVVPVTVGILF